MKEITKINKNLPEGRKLSVQERRAVISAKIYPKYRDQARTKIRLTPLRDTLIKTIRRLPKKSGCDVLAINKTTYQDIPYFEIESFIENILPKCIYVKVNAGEFGETNIFNTRDFNYYSTGVSEITNAINEIARDNNLNTSTIPEYTGNIGLRPKKKNDGTPENYFLEMILSVSNVKPQALKIPYKKKTKAQEQRENNVRAFIRERLAVMRQEKSAFKKIRKLVSKTLIKMRETRTDTLLSMQTRNSTIKELYLSLNAKVKKEFEKGVLSEGKYNSIIARIKKVYTATYKG